MHLRPLPYVIAIVGMFVSARGDGVCDSLSNGRPESNPRISSPRLLIFSAQNLPAELDNTSKTSPKNWSLALSVAGNYAKGLGAYYADSKPGSDYEVRLALSVSRSIALRFCYSRAGIDYEKSVTREAGYFVCYEPDFDVAGVTGGLQWYRWVDRMRQAGPVVYFSVDGGVARHTLAVTTTITSDIYPDLRHRVFNSTETDDRPILRTGMGLLFSIGKSIGFDVNMGLDMIWTKTGGPDDPRKALYGIKGFIVHGAAGINLNI